MPKFGDNASKSANLTDFCLFQAVLGMKIGLLDFL